MICGKLVVEKFKTALDGKVELHTRCVLDKGHAEKCSFAASLERLRSCKAAGVTSEEQAGQAEASGDEVDMTHSSRILRILSAIARPLIILGMVLVLVGLYGHRHSANQLSNRYYVEHHDCVFMWHIDAFTWVVAGKKERYAGYSVYTCKGIDTNVDVDDGEK